MANIILINDQDQDQTLTGVSKLVARGTSGDVEFSIGGDGCKDRASWTVFSEQGIKIDGKSPIFLGPIKYTKSPADVKSYGRHSECFSPCFFKSSRGIVIYYSENWCREYFRNAVYRKFCFYSN